MASVVEIDFHGLDWLIADHVCLLRFHIDILVLVSRLWSSIVCYNNKISSTLTMCNIWHAFLFIMIQCSRFIYYTANPVNPVFISLHLEAYTPLDAITVCAGGQHILVHLFNNLRPHCWSLWLLRSSNRCLGNLPHDFPLFPFTPFAGTTCSGEMLSRIIPFSVITDLAELQFNTFRKRQVDFKASKVGKPYRKVCKCTYNNIMYLMYYFLI